MLRFRLWELAKHDVDMAGAIARLSGGEDTLGFCFCSCLHLCLQPQQQGHQYVQPMPYSQMAGPDDIIETQVTEMWIIPKANSW